MEPRGAVLPIYLVADESMSMIHVMDELNWGLRSLLGAMQAEPFAASKVRFAVIGFADEPYTYLEPADLRAVENLPTLTARGGTNYGAIFDLLKRAIPWDVQSFKTDGFLVHRPAVFFLSDGEPLDVGWEPTLSSVNQLAAHPNIIAFGIGEANPQVIRRIATRPEYAFMAVPGSDMGSAISGFVTSLVQSVVASGQAVGADNARLQIAPPEGFLSLPIDTV